MRPSSRLFTIITSLILLVGGLVAYTIFDNNRFVVIHQSVTIPDLPSQFEGYTILQISDLHSKSFGKNQSELISKIKSLDYDLVAVTGDVQNHLNDDLQPFFDLVDSIDPRDGILLTSGNVDPHFVDFYIGQVTPEGKEMQSHGCRLLDYPVAVERDGARIWFSELFDDRRRENQWVRRRPAGPLDVHYDPAEAAALHQIYQAEIESIFKGITTRDTLIGITHYPVTQNVLDDPAHDGMLPFDLVLAGHYHGGQIRLPFIGAIYIPIPSQPRSGLFPDQRIVSGLYQGNGMQQYISRGMGAGGPVPLVMFRFLNTPEINLLTLHAGK